MKQGTQVEATAIAKQRFSQYFPFDLADETWKLLFDEHRTGVILESIKRCSSTRDHNPDVVYANLLFWIGRLESDRTGGDPPMWPPVGIKKLST